VASTLTSSSRDSTQIASYILARQQSNFGKDDCFGKTVLQQAALQVVTLFLLNVFRQWLVVVVTNFSEEGFQMLGYYLVQYCLLGLIALVSMPRAVTCAQDVRRVRSGGSAGVRFKATATAANAMPNQLPPIVPHS
jgi:hypothetical protein